ncbi:hypothetical protein AB5I41_07815 [Sphingomonas sp. MMS24-JH45]
MMSATVELFDENGMKVGEFATIQAAVDAAKDGDTILVAAGTYAENVSIAKDVTLVGAHAGQAGTAAGRGTDEAIIEGLVTISADGVTLDGFTLTKGAAFAGEEGPIQVYVDAYVRHRPT